MRNIVILFCSLMVLCSCALFSGGPTPESKNENKATLHLQLGTSFLLKGNYPQALRELIEAERLNPNDPIIQNNLGLAYLVRSKYDDAEKRFKIALELNPKYTDARNNLGRLYIDVGMYDKAINELEIAAADLTYEQPEKSWANLGQALFLKKDYEKAKIALQKSLKERRDSCFTMNFYGRTLFEMQNYKTAAESLDQAVRLCEKTKFEEPSFYSALSFYKLGDTDKARARFEEFLQLYPKSHYTSKAQEMLEILK